MKDKLKVTSIKSSAKNIIGKVQPYALLIFIVFVGLIYMYLLVNINTLANVEPSESDIAQQVKTAKTPRLDEETAQKLESLKDNSVSVQSLFEEARSNPFQ